MIPRLCKIWLALLFLLQSSSAKLTITPLESPTISEHPVVIVISFDGVRYDYRSKTDTPNLDALVQDGVTAPYMRSQFMTKTFPNHQSIATGLYTESHGISENKFYNPVTNETIDAFVPEFWNYDVDVVPVWIRNEWAGRPSGTIMWPGSNHPYGANETLPTHFQRWNGSSTFEDRVDLIIDMITDPQTPANIVFLYLEEPDNFGHAFGPESPEIQEQIRVLDTRVGYLTSKLKSLGLYDEVNLILLSDHGFVEIQQSKIINITKLVDPSLYVKSGGSPVWQIYPTGQQSDEETTYESFKNASVGQNFTVYKKEEIPEEWHFGKSRVGPIVLVSDLGYVFDDFYSAITSYNAEFNLTASPDRVYGHHGFDSRSEAMRAFFVAHGPAFRKGYLMNPFDNVDIVPLICHITGLPQPPTNGSLESFKDALAVSSHAVGVYTSTRTNVLYVIASISLLKLAS